MGTAVKVGSKAKQGIKVGDRVGVGAQSYSCLRPDCEDCAAGMENHCPRMAATYGAMYPNGEKTMGGYANYSRVPSHFVFKIPDAIPSEEAAPMLCGGVTVYSPLKENGCGPGKKVGIVGLGGLGHFGVLFAKALGADKITVISRSSTKKADALKVRPNLLLYPPGKLLSFEHGYPERIWCSSCQWKARRSVVLTTLYLLRTGSCQIHRRVRMSYCTPH